MEGQLTASIFAEEEFSGVRALLPVLEKKVGRIVYKAFPTGVEVSWAMVHGGPYPATSDSRMTSVGASAIDRFLRPVCCQNMPETLMPEVLRDGNPWKVRRVQDTLFHVFRGRRLENSSLLQHGCQKGKEVLRDDGVALRCGVDPIALNHTGQSVDVLEQEREERNVVLPREESVGLVELLDVVGTVIRRQGDAGQEKFGPGWLERGKDLVEVFARVPDG